MSVELEIVQDVSNRLTGAGISFMLNGSMAMNAYAQPRMTRDVDVVIEVQAADLERLIAVFQPDYSVGREAVRRALQTESLFNAIHTEFVFKVDCIIRKNTPYRLAEFSRRQRLRVADCETWVVSKEDLILSKLCWGNDSRSEYQARDVRNLLATGCDRRYVLDWAEKLGVLEYLAEIEK